MRSLQPPDILWIHWRVYNSIANTSKGVLLLPPSDAYVRSFLYLLCTLIELYYTKALSNQALSLAPDWIPLLQRPRIPASFTAQQQPFRMMETKSRSWSSWRQWKVIRSWTEEELYSISQLDLALLHPPLKTSIQQWRIESLLCVRHCSGSETITVN